MLPALIAPLAIVRDDPQEVSAGRIYLVVVAIVAFLGGLWPALAATAVSFTALAWLFAPPGEGFADTNQLGSLALFLVAALVISNLLDRRNAAQREAADARQRGNAAAAKPTAPKPRAGESAAAEAARRKKKAALDALDQ